MYIDTQSSMEDSTMGNCLTTCSCAGNLFKKKQPLPIEKTFKFPAATPVWPPGIHDVIVIFSPIC